MWKKLYQDLAPEVGGQTAKELVKKAQEQAKENEKKQKSK